MSKRHFSLIDEKIKEINQILPTFFQSLITFFFKNMVTNILNSEGSSPSLDKSFQSLKSGVAAISPVAAYFKIFVTTFMLILYFFTQFS